MISLVFFCDPHFWSSCVFSALEERRMMVSYVPGTPLPPTHTCTAPRVLCLRWDIYTMRTGSYHKPGNASMKSRLSTHRYSPVPVSRTGGCCETQPSHVLYSGKSFLKGNVWTQKWGRAPHLLKT